MEITNQQRFCTFKGYLDTATKLIDDFLALCPPDQVKAACEIADKNPVKFREYA